MKKITLLKKKIPTPLCPYCLQGLGDKEIEIKSIGMIRIAVEASPENRKGLSNIGKALKILNKIEEAEKMEAEYLETEDADFGIIYRSIDQTEWLPFSLKFTEFFIEIDRVNKAE